jgi:hypothetical protein
MELLNAPLFLMNNLKIGKTERAVEHSPFLKKIATYQCVCVCVCEKAKLIRGDPPKITLKRRGSPPKNDSIFQVVLNF